MYVCLMVLNKSPIKESTQFVSVPFKIQTYNISTLKRYLVPRAY